MKLDFSLTNPFPDTLTGTVRLTDGGVWKTERAEIVFTLQPGQKLHESLNLFSSGPAPAVAYPVFRVQAPSHGVNLENTVKLVACIPVSEKKTRLADLSAADSMVQLRQGDVDADMFWQGPKDLSAQVYAFQRGKNLHLDVEVEDNVHFQEYDNYGIFGGDCVQIAMRNESNAYWQFGAAKSNTGKISLVVWKGKLPKMMQSHVTRKGTRTIYSFVLPLPEMGIPARPGSRFQLSVLINDNDGRCRKVLAEWGGGIHGMSSKPMNVMILD